MMAEMTLLKVLYDQQKRNGDIATDITPNTVHFTPERFELALTSLQEHGYITNVESGKIHVTKKGCLLAKEL